MIMSLRFCLSYYLLNKILSPSKIVHEYDEEIPQSQIFIISMKICIAGMDIVMILLLSGERSGSVVECLTRDRRAAGSSLTGVTALWSLSKTHLS